VSAAPRPSPPRGRWPWWRSDAGLAQLLRYGVVGVANNLLGYLLYLLVTSLGGTPKLTMSVLYAMGAAIGYLGNRRLTFRHRGSHWRSGLRYALVHATGYLLNLSILSLFADRYGYPHQLVQAAAIFAVAAYLFLAFKLFVFTTPSHVQEKP
jgi:putative flippase GtrA